MILSMNGGGEQNVVVSGTGLVYDWGAGTSGQLGNGAYTSTSVPQLVALPVTAKQVAAGQLYSLALSSDGKSVYAWGDNTYGALGIGTSAIVNSDLPLQVILPLPANVSITSIADGGNGAFAVLSNGHVVGWGANEHGQAGQNPAIPGNTDIFTPTLIPKLANVVQVAAGDHQTLALKSDGSVWDWGGNRYGQLGPNGPSPSYTAATYIPVQVTGLPAIAAVATGGEDSLALDTQGHVWSWGRNGFGQLGWGTIDPSDGPHATPQQVVGLSNIVSIDGEGPATLAADAFGNVYAWGFNTQGEVGNGTTTNIGTPQLVLTLPTSPDPYGPSVQVSAGHWFSYAFNAVTGQTFSWGKNTYGELGFTANNVPNTLPTDITSALRGLNATAQGMTFLASSSSGTQAMAAINAGDAPGAAALQGLYSDLQGALPTMVVTNSGYDPMAGIDNGIGMTASYAASLLNNIASALPPETLMHG